MRWQNRSIQNELWRKRLFILAKIVLLFALAGEEIKMKNFTSENTYSGQTYRGGYMDSEKMMEEKSKIKVENRNTQHLWEGGSEGEVAGF